MKILYVTKALIAPPHAGCMQRTTHIVRQLQRRCGDVTMLAVHGRFDPDSVSLCQREFDRFDQVILKSYTAYPKPWGEVLRKFHMHWPTLCGLRADRQGQALFETLAAQHDVVWFHTLGAAQPFRLTPGARTVMDLDDLNHCKYEQSAQIQPTLRFRLSAKIQAYKWKRLERNALRRFSAVVVCSPQDKLLLGGGDRIFVVPNGFDPPAEKPACRLPDPQRLGFISHLAYGPNRDGLMWFRDRVWPLIRREKPDMRLRIVGRIPPDVEVVSAEGFEYLGFIDDPTEEMQSWSAMIVPIPYGGGTRIKILDAFSKCCPVVATSIGAYGIEGQPGRHFLVADPPQQFADCCLRLSRQPEYGRRLAEEGWKLLLEKYTWDHIGHSIAAAANAVVSLSH
jgi:glycosyltransferase involved in cell wall biosynthesis